MIYPKSWFGKEYFSIFQDFPRHSLSLQKYSVWVSCFSSVSLSVTGKYRTRTSVMTKLGVQKSVQFSIWMIIRFIINDFLSICIFNMTIMTLDQPRIAPGVQDCKNEIVV